MESFIWSFLGALLNIAFKLLMVAAAIAVVGFVVIVAWPFLKYVLYILMVVGLFAGAQYCVDRWFDKMGIQKDM